MYVFIFAFSESAFRDGADSEYSTKILDVLFAKFSKDDIQEKLVSFLLRNTADIFKKKPWKMNKRDVAMYTKIAKKYKFHVFETESK
jgi:hypothetical protein